MESRPPRDETKERRTVAELYSMYTGTTPQTIANEMRRYAPPPDGEILKPATLEEDTSPSASTVENVGNPTIPSGSGTVHPSDIGVSEDYEIKESDMRDLPSTVKRSVPTTYFK